MAQIYHIFAVWWLQRGQHWTLLSVGITRKKRPVTDLGAGFELD